VAACSVPLRSAPRSGWSPASHTMWADAKRRRAASRSALRTASESHLTRGPTHGDGPRGFPYLTRSMRVIITGHIAGPRLQSGWSALLAACSWSISAVSVGLWDWFGEPPTPAQIRVPIGSNGPENRHGNPHDGEETFACPASLRDILTFLLSHSDLRHLRQSPAVLPVGTYPRDGRLCWQSRRNQSAFQDAVVHRGKIPELRTSSL
jgi:hypothetical protein